MKTFQTDWKKNGKISWDNTIAGAYGIGLKYSLPDTNPVEEDEFGNKISRTRRIISRFCKEWGYLLYNWIHNRVDWKNQRMKPTVILLDELKYFTDTPTDANEQAESLKKFFKNKKAVELVYKRCFNILKTKKL